MSDRTLSAVPLLLVTALLAWWLRVTLATGTVSGKGGRTVTRAAHPVRFGIAVGALAALGLFTAGLAGLALLR